MDNQAGLVEVELWSVEPSAVEAVRNTLRMLGAPLIEQDKRFYVPDGYPAFACEH